MAAPKAAAEEAMALEERSVMTGHQEEETEEATEVATETEGQVASRRAEGLVMIVRTVKVVTAQAEEETATTEEEAIVQEEEVETTEETMVRRRLSSVRSFLRMLLRPRHTLMSRC